MWFAYQGHQRALNMKLPETGLSYQYPHFLLLIVTTFGTAEDTSGLPVWGRYGRTTATCRPAAAVLPSLANDSRTIDEPITDIQTLQASGRGNQFQDRFS
jgi:hypothetical protein